MYFAVLDGLHSHGRRFLAESHVDPWGLEGTGANVPELGSKMGHGPMAMFQFQLRQRFIQICFEL